jgi:catechol 2,3-dioxygenase-like lactoylglutathione lyase family enzyme
MIRGMHHISLATTDMDRFVRFYRDLLGVTLDRISALPPDFEAFVAWCCFCVNDWLHGC